MPNEFLINSNDTENGYIYKELNNRISRMENTMENLFNLMEQLNTLGISPSELVTMMTEINKKASVQYVQNHVEDSVRHLNDVKVLEWDTKYSKPINGIPEVDLHADVRRKLNDGGGTTGGLSGILKFSITIGNNSNTSFTIQHNLNSRDINVSVWDNFTRELVYPEIGIISADTIKVNFLTKPTLNQYNIVIIG
jgi:hypothetical protein